MALLILLVFLIAFSVIGVPLAYSIGLSCMSYLSVTAPELMQMMPQRVWSGAFSYLMVATPMFILMGELMNESGITSHILDFCMYMVRPIKGGLGEVNVIASMIFGGISGSSVADTSALGSILIPEMEKQGYPPEFSAGITVASSTMGMIIPPSIPMIMFAMVSGASIGGLFMAGLVPGVVIGVTQILLCYIISKRKGYHPKQESFDMKKFKRVLLFGLPSILMPLVIVLSVSFGICTASESAGIAVLYTLFLGFCLYHRLTVKAILKALYKTMIASGSICIIIGFSTIFTWILTVLQIPQVVADFFISLNLAKWQILIVFDILILLMGTFIDVSPAILMLTPIMLPVMRAFGVSDYQFGAMFITGLAIGLATPPVGMCLNTCNKINHMPILKIFRGAAPFILCNVIVLLLISFIPILTTYLPGVFA